ncbi:ABC transporter permease [Mucilaginibacter sp.]|jgi:ABC-type antimicrobial peptide transport system permease subunit|uniref:ABC transporter permease n=1 Tax=Mucilaginibacter sp. TaxID=1882438 RepID=UPI00356661D3
MFKNYLKIAWRNITKHKGFSFINAGGLALGMASCLLLLLYVNYHLSFDKQFKNADNVYLVENNQQGDGKIFTFLSTPGQMAATIQAQVPGVERAIRISNYAAGGLISYKNNSFKKVGLFSDDGYFKVFPYKFIKGNPATAIAQPNSIVITQSLAKTLFGNENPINKIVKRNDKTELMVTGVVEDPAPNRSFQFDYVMPWKIFENELEWIKTATWSSNFCQTAILLKDPKYFKHADGLVRKMINSHQSEYKAEAFLFPYTQLHLYSKFENGKSVGGLIEQVNLFIVLAICILLIACVNFMNLSTARSEERAKEVGIRKAIGSNRSSLVWQFIIESVILSVLSMVAAFILLVISIPFFNDLLNIKLALPYNDLNTWVILIGFAVLTGFISGSYPAFYLSSFEPIKVLKGVFKGGSSALPVRKIMVVVQFTFTVFLITATICIYRQIRFTQSRSIGYNKGGLVEVKIEGTLDKNTGVVINQLKGDNVVTNATVFSQSITSSGNNTWGVEWPGKRPDQKILFDMFKVGYDFTRTAGIKLIDGREFSAQYPADTAGKTVMINEAAAKAMNLKNPVGSIITVDQPVTVIGVYKDFVWGSPYQKAAPMINFCNLNGGVIAMRLNAAKSISANLDVINKTLKSINPAYPPTVNFVDSDFEKKFENEKLLATLANIFGGLAIIISCLGLFGLAAYAAEQRVKEIGVRKVLGASITSLAGLLSKDFLKLVAIAIIVAVPLSIWAMNKWLQNYEYHITLSWWMFAMAGLITVFIAIATVSYQAIKAALANPVKSLRSE